MLCRPRACLSGMALLLLVAFPSFGEESALLTETSLRPAPAAEEISAFLTEGTPVEVLERGDGWVRVRLEGWVRAATVAESVTPPSPAPAPARRESPPMAPPPGATPATPPPGGTTSAPPPGGPPAVSPATASPRAGGSVEGLIRVKLSRRKKLSAAGMEVMLLPSPPDPGVTAEDPDELARIAALDEEAARLAKEAEKAMQMTRFSEATMTHDKLMAEREEVLEKRRDLLAARHGRHEQAARAAAVQATVVDANGWFSISSVPPGAYTFYGRMIHDKADLEWIESVTVGDRSVRLDLDESRARGLPPK